MGYLALRDFRIKHKITLAELAEKSGITQQRLSETELCVISYQPAIQTQTRILKGLAMIVSSREKSLKALAQEFETERLHLFELI